MLKPVAMKKVRMVGLLADLPAALSLWRRLGAIQLEATPFESLGISKGTPLEAYDAISEQLVKIRAIKNALIPVPITPEPLNARPVELAKKIDISEELVQIASERDKMKKRIEPLTSRKNEISRLIELNVDFAMLPKSLAFHIYSIEKSKILQIREKFAKHFRHSQWLEAADPQNKKNLLALVAVPRDETCAKVFEGCEQLKVPKICATARQAVLKMDAEIADINETQRKLNFRLNELSEKYYPQCARLEEALALDAKLARTASKFANSGKCFYAQGWIKADDFARFERTSRKFLNDNIDIRCIPEHLHNNIGCPTVLSNPKPARPFQFLVEFLSIPRPDEIDPSFFLLFTIPIVYALIVGDAGYAVVTLILAYLINKKVQKGGMMDNFTRIWMLGALPTFIFGILFDEYFGYSHAQILGEKLYTPLIHRVGDVQGLLLLTILVGWFNILFGFLLGIINEWKHSKKHAFAKLSWILVQIGGTGLVATFLLGATGMEVGLPSIIIFAIGAAGLLVFEGVMGLVEIPGLASNIMSYVRIAAVGIAGVILAEAINSLLAPDPASLATLEGMVIFILISIAYAIAHAVNAFVAMFESFIHGSRLSVIEFFGKFYKGGGTSFSPLTLRRKYTLEPNVQPNMD